jgi:hypothetical protein
MGVDLGIITLATSSDDEIFRGQAVEHTRQRMSTLRARLQSAGTKSAKRHLFLHSTTLVFLSFANKVLKDRGILG